MNGTFIFAALGSLLLVVLLVFLRRNTASLRRASGLSETHEALNALQSELLPDWFVDRLFSKEDREFVLSQDVPGAPLLFDKDRKAVALSWLRQTQEHVAQLMAFHVSLARQRPDLRPSVELRLTLEYLQFQLVCALLAGLIRTVGPSRVRSIAGHAVDIATHLGDVSEQALTSMDDAVGLNAAR